MPFHVTVREALIAGGVFVASLLVSSAVVVALVVLIPVDYFAPSHAAPGAVRRRGPLGIARAVGKNLLGLLLVAVGLVLSIPGVPGQGLLTILTGIILLDVPGKRRLERQLVARPLIRRNVDRLRRRFGRAPLDLGTGAPPTSPGQP